MSKSQLLSSILGPGTSGIIASNNVESAITPTGGVVSYPNILVLPLANNTIGDQAFVENGDSDRLYIWNDGGWFSITLMD